MVVRSPRSDTARCMVHPGRRRPHDLLCGCRRQRNGLVAEQLDEIAVVIAHNHIGSLTRLSGEWAEGDVGLLGPQSTKSCLIVSRNESGLHYPPGRTTGFGGSIVLLNQLNDQPIALQNRYL